MYKTFTHRLVPKHPFSRLLVSSCRIRRYQHNGSYSKTPIDNDPASNLLMEESFARHTMFVLNTGKRALKFTAIGLIGLGIVATATYEGAHIWVENHELAPENDPESKHWEWDLEAEDWTGDEIKGGTDPGLGFKGRHTVRAAWMAHNWGVGYSTAAVGTDSGGTEGLSGPAGIKVIDAQLQRAEDFLRTAVSIAETRTDVHPQTLTTLLARHANVMERLGPDYWAESKQDYRRVWERSVGNTKLQAWTANKIGNLSSYLGDMDDGLSWWLKTLQLTLPNPPNSLDQISETLTTPPSSPAAQRTTASTLVSLSATYARSGQLGKAQQVEEAGLAMLRLIKPPNPLESPSSPHLLHSLFLLQRSSLLSVHLAEVLYAQRKPVKASIQWLRSAAASSEQVACTLTGSQPFSQDGVKPESLASQPISTAYSSPRSTCKVAKALLRDARKTCAEAWNLMGILHETQAKDLPLAIHCYQKAVEWAGTPSSRKGRHPAEGILEAEFNGYLANLSRLERILDGKK